MRNLKSLKLSITVFLLGLFVSPAIAGDAVTLVFREGQVVYLNYGFKAISDAYRGLRTSSDSQRVMELSLEGGAFLIDLSQVVIVCRDECKGMDVKDPRATKKPS